MAAQTDSLSLVNKVAIITGSGKENGIGAAIALTLARAGARVVINHVSDASVSRAQTVLTKIQSAVGKDNVLLVRADLTTVEGTKKIVDETLKGFGVDHIDILVNNAYKMGTGTSILSTPPDVIRGIFDVDVFGTIMMMQAVVPHMPRGGRIINIGSIISKIGVPGLEASVATKAAMASLTYALSKELGLEKGITINTIAPGPVLTDSLPQNVEAVRQMSGHLIGLARAEQRFGTTDDIADVVLFIASEKSRWITGQWISASGGSTGL